MLWGLPPCPGTSASRMLISTPPISASARARLLPMNPSPPVISTERPLYSTKRPCAVIVEDLEMTYVKFGFRVAVSRNWPSHALCSLRRNSEGVLSLVTRNGTSPGGAFLISPSRVKPPQPDQPEPQREEVERGAGDAPESKELRAPVPARIVAHGGLGEDAPRSVELAHQLDADDAARRNEVEPLDDPPTHQPEIAIHVANRESEKNPRQPVVHPADHFARARVRATYLIPVDHTDRAGHQRVEGHEFAHVVLPVAVRVEDQLLTRVAEPRAERRAVAAVALVVNDPDVRRGAGQFFQHVAGRVGAPVVDDEHLEVVGQCGQDIQRVRHQRRDTACIIKGREENCYTSVA